MMGIDGAFILISDEVFTVYTETKFIFSSNEFEDYRFPFLIV